MVLAAWVSLGFFLVALVGSGVLLGIRGLGAWRRFKRFTGAMTEGVDGVLRTAGAAEEHAQSLTEKTERLTKALAHLQVSLATLSKLRAALDEAQGTILFARGAVPRK